MRTARPPRRGAPPPPEFFEAERPAAGGRAVALELGAVRIVLARLDDARADAFLARFGAYARTVERGAADALAVEVGLEARDYFLDPPPTPELNPVFLAFDADRVRMLAYKVAGWIEPRARRGRLLLARGTYEPDVRAIENYVRVAVAWLAVERGGALVHAASAVWQDRAYLFYGASGAGKSTLAASNRRGRIVSDDLSLVLPGAGGRLELVGSPFRGTYDEGPPVHGTFPLAAGFRLIQAGAARVEPVPRLRALSELVANLPFVAEACAERPDLLERVQHAFRDVPLAHLHFRKDDTYWDAIASAGR